MATSKAIEDGGPAFPVFDKSEQWCKGMTLRDYIAVAAMQGEIACSNRNTICNDGGYENLADKCYLLADAMLERRKIK